MNEPLNVVQGRAIPFYRADVDTDQIIPARHLKRIERTGFGQFAFELWRQDDDFVLNDPHYQGAPILLAGPNFGCGSSREHAVWALADMGLRVIIAPSFADIFRNNCASNGVLAIALTPEQCTALVEWATTHRDEKLAIDLAQQTIVAADGEAMSFEIEPTVKHRLINGLDLISAALTHEEQIARYEASRPSFFPCVRH